MEGGTILNFPRIQKCSVCDKKQCFCFLNASLCPACCIQFHEFVENIFHEANSGDLILHDFGRYRDNQVKSTKSIEDLMTLASFDTVTTLRAGS